MKFKIREIDPKSEGVLFFQIPKIIYEDDQNWVAPLEDEVYNIFSPTKNKLLAHGKSKWWILRDEDERDLGRIAAFYNKRNSEKAPYLLGRVGFFECINNKEAAHILFDTAGSWLRSEGMEAMEGPVNFGENDRYWGLLVHGFTHPSFGMNYNPPYYQSLFESYGFNVFFEQVSKHLDLTKPFPERFRNIFERLKRNGKVKVVTPTKRNLSEFGTDFLTIFNDAWEHHENFDAMKPEDVGPLIKSFKMVLIPKFLVFCYVKDEPAGFILGIPDLNQVFKPLLGKFPILQKILFLWRSRNDFAWYRRKGILNRLRVVIIGVRPQFQKMGLESALAVWSLDDAISMGFKEVELSWVGEFNPMSRRLQDATNAQLGKIHNTYRIALKEGVEIKPMETLLKEKMAVEKNTE